MTICLLVVNISIWLVLLGLTIFSFIVAYISAKIDAKQIKKKWGNIITLNHTSRTIIRLAIFSLISFLIYNNIYHFILYIAFQWFVFSLMFDLLLNKFRGNTIWYIGNTASSDRLIRKYLGENSGKKYTLIKLLFCVFLSIGIILI